MELWNLGRTLLFGMICTVHHKLCCELLGVYFCTLLFSEIWGLLLLFDYSVGLKIWALLLLVGFDFNVQKSSSGFQFLGVLSELYILTALCATIC